MIWVTFDDIVQLHRLIIRKTGGLEGLRDSGLLEAALAAPFQSFGGEDLFRSPVEKNCATWIWTGQQSRIPGWE